MLALPGGQALAQLTGLRVHEVCGEPAGVPPEEDVGQRDVPPEEALQVQLHEEHGQGVHEAHQSASLKALGEHRAVRQGEAQVPGDEGRRQGGAVVGRATRDHRHGQHRG